MSKKYVNCFIYVYITIYNICIKNLSKLIHFSINISKDHMAASSGLAGLLGETVLAAAESLLGRVG